MKPIFFLFFGAIKQANNHVSKRFFYCDLSTQALGHFELKLRIWFELFVKYISHFVTHCIVFQSFSILFFFFFYLFICLTVCLFICFAIFVDLHISFRSVFFCSAKSINICFSFIFNLLIYLFYFFFGLESHMHKNWNSLVIDTFMTAG